MSLAAKILIGLLLGLTLGMVHSLAELAALASLPGFVEPIGRLWVNALSMTVIPLLMALIVTAIAGQASTRLLAKLGGRTLGLLLLMIVASSTYSLLLAPPLLALLALDPSATSTILASTASTAVSRAELPPFRDWLLALIPSNPFLAAVNTAILPLLIFTGLFASALLRIEEAQRVLMVSFFTAIKEAMFVLINWIMRLAPVGVFALVFPLTAALGVSALTSLAAFIAIACGLILLMTLMLYPLASIGGRLPLRKLIVALAPVQVISFSTRSSLAALPATFAATEALGISTKISGVVLPIAVTLFKFASPIARITGTYFIASLYGIDLSFYAMLIIAATIGLFSFYSPGIPSGGLLVMAPVYVSLGLPVEGIGILIAVDLIIDMFITMANVTANVTAVALLSRHER